MLCIASSSISVPRAPRQPSQQRHGHWPCAATWGERPGGLEWWPRAPEALPMWKPPSVLPEHMRSTSSSLGTHILKRQQTVLGALKEPAEPPQRLKQRTREAGGQVAELKRATLSWVLHGHKETWAGEGRSGRRDTAILGECENVGCPGYDCSLKSISQRKGSSRRFYCLKKNRLSPPSNLVWILHHQSDSSH